MSTAAEADKLSESSALIPFDWSIIKAGSKIAFETSHYITTVEGLSGQKYYTLRKAEAPGIHDGRQTVLIEGFYMGEIPFLPDGHEIGDPDLLSLARSQMCRLIEKARDQGTRLPFIIPPDAKTYHAEPLAATS